MKTKKKEIKKTKLNPKYELFCYLYVKDRECFDNATWSYARAFGYNLEVLSREAVYEEVEQENGFTKTKKIEDSPYDKACNVCAVNGARLLRNSKINKRVEELLLSLLTPETVDAEMSWVIKQRGNLSAKNAAMREFNKLKGRIIDKFEINNVPIDPNLARQGDNVLEKYLNGIAKNTTKE